MPPRPRGARALTGAERQRLYKERQRELELTLAAALMEIRDTAGTIKEARAIAREALEPLEGEGIPSADDGVHGRQQPAPPAFPCPTCGKIWRTTRMRNQCCVG